MALTISAGDRRFSIKLPEDECHRRFGEFVLSLIADYPAEAASAKTAGGGYYEAPISGASANPAEDEPAGPITSALAEPIDKSWDTAHLDHEEDPPQAAYKGFLYVECSHCGKTWGFNAKEERTSVLCRECGKETSLIHMVKAYVNCQCGRRFKYQTNHTSDLFDINCLDCGSPVPLGYNKKKGTYETL